MKVIYAFFCIIIFFYSCRKQSINCSKVCNSITEVLFQTGFSNTSFHSITKDWYYLSGTDTLKEEPNSWENFQNHDCIGNISINYGNGTEKERWASIVQDPIDSSNEVLSFRIISPNDSEPGKKKGRVELDLNRNNCIQKFSQEVQLLLDSDMKELTQWNQSFYWLSIFEFWNNANWTQEKYPFRVTVNIVKPNSKPNTPLYFHVKADIYKQFGKWEKVWEHTSKNFEVPFGTWMNIELCIIEGNTSTGSFTMKVSTSNTPKQTLFAINNYTQHPKETCPDGYSEIHPLKLYTYKNL